MIRVSRDAASRIKREHDLRMKLAYMQCEFAGNTVEIHTVKVAVGIVQYERA